MDSAENSSICCNGFTVPCNCHLPSCDKRLGLQTTVPMLSYFHFPYSACSVARIAHSSTRNWTNTNESSTHMCLSSGYHCGITKEREIFHFSAICQADDESSFAPHSSYPGRNSYYKCCCGLHQVRTVQRIKRICKYRNQAKSFRKCCTNTFYQNLVQSDLFNKSLKLFAFFYHIRLADGWHSPVRWLHMWILLIFLSNFHLPVYSQLLSNSKVILNNCTKSNIPICSPSGRLFCEDGSVNVQKLSDYEAFSQQYLYSSCDTCICSNLTCPEDFCCVLRTDQKAYLGFRAFYHTMENYAFPQNYSIRSDKEKCLVAYKKWICSFFNSNISRQDSSLCLTVESLCPFFRIHNKTKLRGGQSSFICQGYNDHHGDTSNHVKRSKDRSLPFETRPVTHAHSNTDVTRRTVRHDATDRRVHRHASAAAESDSSVTTTVWRNGAQSSTIGAARRVVSVFFAACNALMLSRPC